MAILNQVSMEYKILKIDTENFQKLYYEKLNEVYKLNFPIEFFKLNKS